MPGVKCPTCAAKGQEVWVIPGKSCHVCHTPCGPSWESRSRRCCASHAVKLILTSLVPCAAAYVYICTFRLDLVMSHHLSHKLKATNSWAFLQCAQTCTKGLGHLQNRHSKLRLTMESSEGRKMGFTMSLRLLFLQRYTTFLPVILIPEYYLLNIMMCATSPWFYFP